ncbi:kinase-like domain-containing protein [Suillus subluteus]|nr:kinase-like domain-containing protein [Suillus subluteus]
MHATKITALHKLERVTWIDCKCSPDAYHSESDISSSHQDDSFRLAILQNAKKAHWHLVDEWAPDDHKQKFYIIWHRTSYHDSCQEITVTTDLSDAPPDSLEAAIRDTNDPAEKIPSFIFNLFSREIPDSAIISHAGLKKATAFLLLIFIKIVVPVSITYGYLLSIDSTRSRGNITNPTLRVYVSEDTSEKKCYPRLRHFQHHISNGMPVYQHYFPRDIQYISHITKHHQLVIVDGKHLVFKGPKSATREDMNDFETKIERLFQMRDIKSIIPLRGLVTDSQGQHITGYLVPYLEHQSFNGYLNGHGQDPYTADRTTRLKWCRQLLEAVGEYHRRGVLIRNLTPRKILFNDHWDLTLGEVSLYGCSYGYEPPELLPVLASGGKMRDFWSEKSDLAQLGVVIWSLITSEKAPTRLGSLLPLDDKIPSYLRYIISNCRGDIKYRMNADALLQCFEKGADEERSITWV